MTEYSQTVRRACQFCRKRKLRCNKEEPSCDSCDRLGQICHYDADSIQPSRSRITKIKTNNMLLQRHEARLARIEQLLQTGRTPMPEQLSPETASLNANYREADTDGSLLKLPDSIIEDLEDIYFSSIHPSISIIHRASYLSSSRQKKTQSPSALSYAMWALASSISSTYSQYSEELYESARKQQQLLEKKSRYERRISMECIQACTLLAWYDLAHGHFDSCWTSMSQAWRLFQILNMRHPINHTANSSLPSIDAVKKEERNRAFWVLFTLDRYAYMSQSLPTTISITDKQSLSFTLPISDDAYQASRTEHAFSLVEALHPEDPTLLSRSASFVVMIHLCASKMQELQSKETEDIESYILHRTWVGDGSLINFMLTTFSLPSHLRVNPAYIDSDSLYFNMAFECATLCVQRMMLRHLEKLSSPTARQYASQCRSLCLRAASSISILLKNAIQQNLRTFHPCTAFCVYNALSVHAELLDSEENLELKERTIFMIMFMKGLRSSDALARSLCKDIEISFPHMMTNLTRDSEQAASESTSPEVDLGARGTSALLANEKWDSGSDLLLQYDEVDNLNDCDTSLMEIGGKSHQWPDYGLEFQMFDGSQQYFDIEATFDGV